MGSRVGPQQEMPMWASSEAVADPPWPSVHLVRKTQPEASNSTGQHVARASTTKELSRASGSRLRAEGAARPGLQE